jgi:hypothetical protein
MVSVGMATSISIDEVSHLLPSYSNLVVAVSNHLNRAGNKIGKSDSKVTRLAGIHAFYT